MFANDHSIGSIYRFTRLLTAIKDIRLLAGNHWGQPFTYDFDLSRSIVRARPFLDALSNPAHRAAADKTPATTDRDRAFRRPSSDPPPVIERYGATTVLNSESLRGSRVIQNWKRARPLFASVNTVFLNFALLRWMKDTLFTFN